ncbi:MAG: transposase [Alphaproteobacteria bacterium]|nr:transposase [Alphaproteobacteria bacterium]
MYRRHDRAEQGWGFLELRRAGQLGRHSQRQPEFIDSVFRIMRTDAPWRDLPTDYGDPEQYAPSVIWCDRGVWERLLEILIDKPDDKWLMIDASHRKVHASGARGGNQEMSRTKGGSTQNCHLAVDRRACRLLYLRYRSRL